MDSTRYKLMVVGSVFFPNRPDHAIPIWRGMTILASDGVEAGKLAAVVVDSATNQALDLLMSRLPERSGYWLVPLVLVVGVSEERIQLSASANEVHTLPQWHGA